MMTTLENMARAICEAREPGMCRYPECAGACLEHEARAATEAIMKPSQAVLDAAEKLDGYTAYDENASAESHWQAMCQAILDGK